MDSREQRVRERITQLQEEIDKLTTEIEQKRSEQKRFQDALDVWLSVEMAPPEARVTNALFQDTTVFRYRFRGRRFLDCVYTILSDRGPQSTAFIHHALLAGGFESESANFRSIVSNMLNEAAKDGRLVKTGERLNAAWSLPPSYVRVNHPDTED